MVAPSFAGWIRSVIRQIGCECSGATAIEYGLIAAIISITIIGALSGVGFDMAGMYNSVMGTIGSTLAGAN